MKKGPFTKDIGRLWIYMSLSDCWMKKGKPIFFYIKKITSEKRSEIPAGGYVITIIAFYMVLLHIAVLPSGMVWRDDE